MRTSSIRMSREARDWDSEVAGRRPNSNLVSASMTPRASAWVAASATELTQNRDQLNLGPDAHELESELTV